MKDNYSFDNMSVANPVLCLNIPKGGPGGSRSMKEKNGTHCVKINFDCFFIYLQQFFWDNNQKLNHQWSEQKQKLKSEDEPSMIRTKTKTKIFGWSHYFFLSQKTTVFSYISVVRSKYHFFHVQRKKYAKNSLKFVFGNL